jgi:acyl-homoserine lactone acylase PvdQ
MFLMRTVAQGRLSELLASDDSTLAVDSFMRKQGFYAKAQLNQQHYSKNTQNILTKYAEGVNSYLQVRDNYYDLDNLG